MEEINYFISYTRKDAEFVLKLAEELRAHGVKVWLDQLDILGGERWDRAVEDALQACQGMIAVLSPDALASNNVMDEVSYALEERKIVIPILLHSCTIPFRLRRVQYIDFTAGYERGFLHLLRALRLDQPTRPRASVAPAESIGQNVTAPPKERPQRVTRREQPLVKTGSPAAEKQITPESATISGIQISCAKPNRGVGNIGLTCEAWPWDSREAKFRPYWEHRSGGTSVTLSWKQSTMIPLEPQKYKIIVFLTGEGFTHSAGANMPSGVAGRAEIECTVQHGQVNQYLYKPPEENWYGLLTRF